MHVQRKKDHFKITVVDNGIGFDEGGPDRIFRPFQQLHERIVIVDGNNHRTILDSLQGMPNGTKWISSLENVVDRR